MSEKLTNEITGKGNAEQFKCSCSDSVYLLSYRRYSMCVCVALIA